MVRLGAGSGPDCSYGERPNAIESHGNSGRVAIGVMHEIRGDFLGSDWKLFFKSIQQRLPIPGRQTDRLDRRNETPIRRHGQNNRRSGAPTALAKRTHDDPRNFLGCRSG